MQTLEARRRGIDLDNNLWNFTSEQNHPRRSHWILSTSLLSHLDNLRTGAHARTRNNAPVFRNGAGLDNGDIQLVIRLVHRVPAVHEVDGEHAQVLVEELDVAVVDALGDLLADLVGTAALDHVEAGPAVLGLGAGGGADEQVVFEFTLEAIPLDVVGEGGGDFSREREMLYQYYFWASAYLAGRTRGWLTWGIRHR
jgi:hypothetical protein